MLVRIANRKTLIRLLLQKLLQKQSDLGLQLVLAFFGRQLGLKILEHLPCLHCTVTQLRIKFAIWLKKAIKV